MVSWDDRGRAPPSPSYSSIPGSPSQLYNRNEALSASLSGLKTNMLGEYAGRTKGAVPNNNPVEVNGRVVLPSQLHRSSTLQRLLRPDAMDPKSKTERNSQVHALFASPTRSPCGSSHPLPASPAQFMGAVGNLGGNPTRLTATDAALLAGATQPIGLNGRGGGKAPKPTRNPITGEVRRAVPRAPSANGWELGFAGKPLLFPPRGTLRSIGSFSSSPSGTSAKSRAKTEKLEYEIFLEAERAAAADRMLRQVKIRGRSRPPWVGDSEASGYRSLDRSRLYPQTR